MIRLDPRCPEHGLRTLDIPKELLHFSYEDGIEVHAKDQAAADEMHAGIVSRRRMTPEA